MRDVKVSICCITYNHEKYIRKTLEGFVMQKTNFDFEIVVHDDASTDGTVSIIKEYEAKYPNLIKPIYQKENQYSKGVSIINIMLANMNGKYIACCEGDDYWVDDKKLQSQYDIMENHPQVFMCTHRVQCVNEECTEKHRIIPESKYGIWKDCLISSEEMANLLYNTDGYPFHTSSYFLRREVLTDELTELLRGYINGDAVRMRTAMHLGGVYFINSVMSHRRLWTVGNWNSRMKKIDNEKRADYLIKALDGEIMFDQATEYRFHKWILPFVYQKMYLMMRECQMIKTSQTVKKYMLKHCLAFVASKQVLKKMGKYYLYKFRVILKKR